MPRPHVEITAGRREMVIKSTNDTVDEMDADFVDGVTSFFSKAIYIGVAGSLEYIPAGMTTSVTRYNMLGGQQYVIAAKQIVSAGTTADEISVVYDLENQ